MGGSISLGMRPKVRSVSPQRQTIAFQPMQPCFLTLGPAGLRLEMAGNETTEPSQEYGSAGKRKGVRTMAKAKKKKAGGGKKC